ncbi:MAG: glycosyl transferase family 1 [Deltaproteobacteria bacterium]|nr:glycosyl transferase family 1 [Deltaproteobacteria bacterium]
MNSGASIRRLRVLFFGEGTSLAHTVRPLELAATLDPALYDVHFCCDPRYCQLVRERGLSYHPIHCVSPEIFHSRVYKASALYHEEELAAYMKEDLQWILELRPDVVVGDFRLSLSTSAEVADIPSITLGNAYWSPRAALPMPVPEHPLTRIVGVWGMRQVLRVTSGFFFRLQVRGINRLRRPLGLKPLAHAQQLFTGGTKTLFLDLPQLMGLPSQLSHHEEIVGPVNWEPAGDLPEWWNELDQHKPRVVISSGSSGAVDATLDALAGLQQLNVELVLATAGRIPLHRVPPGVRTCEFIPGKKAAREADLVVCNGGVMAYQPLSEGVPVLGIPLNIDQHYIMDAIERKGAGISVRAGRATPHAIRMAAETLLNNTSYRQAAQEIQRQIHALNPAQALARAIHSVCDQLTHTSEVAHHMRLSTPPLSASAGALS